MPRKMLLQPRREPQQRRSRQMRDDILTAAVRVLRKEGALRFTTPRVAEAAGISVGSLYQYFPNKHSLIFAIHTRTVEHTWLEVQRILDQSRWSPREKIRRVAHLFFCEESAEVAEMGAALEEAEVFFAEQPKHSAMDEMVLRRLTRFVREAIPSAPPARVRFSARLLMVTLENVGRAVAGMALSKRELGRWSRTCADMLATQLGLPA